ncbi:hypothetical protein BDZ91DRAFT_712195 [Kalaharituber pfeilii]|nr:hypothetical protein BDZ91DRAFT_712195 [Kalaharituber pfeilii]
MACTALHNFIRKHCSIEEWEELDADSRSNQHEKEEARDTRNHEEGQFEREGQGGNVGIEGIRDQIAQEMWRDYLQIRTACIANI